MVLSRKQSEGPVVADRSTVLEPLVHCECDGEAIAVWPRRRVLIFREMLKKKITVARGMSGSARVGIETTEGLKIGLALSIPLSGFAPCASSVDGTLTLRGQAQSPVRSESGGKSFHRLYQTHTHTYTYLYIYIYAYHVLDPWKCRLCVWPFNRLTTRDMRSIPELGRLSPPYV